MRHIFSSLEKITFRFSNKQQLMRRCLIIIYLYLTCTVSDTFGECALHAVAIHCLDFTWRKNVLTPCNCWSAGLRVRRCSKEKWKMKKKPEQKNKALEVYPRFCLFFFFETEKREEIQSAARFEEKASLERQHNINERSVKERKENV